MMNNRRITLKTSWVQEECSPKAQSTKVAGNGAKCPSCGCPLRITSDGKASCWFCEKEFSMDPSMMVKKEEPKVEKEPEWGRSIHDLNGKEREGIVNPAGKRVELEEEEEELGFEIEFEEECPEDSEGDIEDEEEVASEEEESEIELEFEEDGVPLGEDATPEENEGGAKDEKTSVGGEEEEVELEFELDDEEEEEEEWEPPEKETEPKRKKRFVSEADVEFDP